MQTEKDGELEKEKRNKGKKSTNQQENDGKEEQKSVVNRFLRVKCKVDAILSHGIGAWGCITVELKIPERKHGMVESEFSWRGENKGKMG